MHECYSIHTRAYIQYIYAELREHCVTLTLFIKQGSSHAVREASTVEMNKLLTISKYNNNIPFSASRFIL